MWHFIAIKLRTWAAAAMYIQHLRNSLLRRLLPISRRRVFAIMRACFMFVLGVISSMLRLVVTFTGIYPNCVGQRHVMLISVKLQFTRLHYCLTDFHFALL